MPDLCKRLYSYPGASDPFAPGEHVGLDFYYGEGKVRKDNSVTHVAADTITLADNTLNYIQADPETGAISTNTTGYTTGLLPLYRATTVAGEITAATDDRCFFSTGTGTGPVEDTEPYYEVPAVMTGLIHPEPV